MEKLRRISLIQNQNWTFMYGNIEEAKLDIYDDSNWYHIGIPHSFGIPYFMENHFYVGYGCYRKTINIKQEWINKRINLEFQGVFQEAEIYINGLLAGTHKGGYTAFIINISSYVKAGSNLLFVKVNNNWNPKLAPRAGEHVFNGGIYRDVSLFITEPIHVAWYGTFVKTPKVSKAKADLEILTEIENHTTVLNKGTLISTIEFEKKTISCVSSSFTIFPNESTSLIQKQAIASPNLWHPDNPNLYILKSRVYIDNVLCDEYITEFGIRWFSFTAKDGFFINGKHYDILGANVHQDQAGWGDAVTHTAIARDIKLIKDCGMNFIRGSHYPHHTAFATECDRQGLLFWSELCFWGIGGFGEDGYWNSSAYPVNPQDQMEFEESCIAALKEMILTNRNHPSIIVWSMCNEVFFSRSEVLNYARNLVKKLVSISHECDNTRPAATGGAQRAGFDLLGDLAGYNGDGAYLYMDPGFPSFVAEYGSKISDRPGEYISCYTEGVQQNYSWRSGKSIWCGFHHGSIADKMGHMGFIDYYRLPLLSWYWYRHELLGIDPPQPVPNGIPHALKLTADRLLIQADGTEDSQIILTVIDKNKNRIRNSMPVTLQIIKGKALFATGRSITLTPDNNSFIDGLGAATLRAFYAGEIVVKAFAPSLESNELILTGIGGEPWINQKLNLQPKPPCFFVPDFQKHLSNQAKNRPVFCSSYTNGFSPQNINDGNNSTSWKPNDNETGAWLIQDLEGIKEIDRIEIYFGMSPKVPVIVSISKHGNSFEVIATETINRTSHLTIQLENRKLSYIKIQFPDKSGMVQNIEVY